MSRIMVIILDTYIYGIISGGSLSVKLFSLRYSGRQFSDLQPLVH